MFCDRETTAITHQRIFRPSDDEVRVTAPFAQIRRTFLCTRKKGHTGDHYGPEVGPNYRNESPYWIWSDAEHV